MPKGAKHVTGEDGMETHLASEVEEIKGRLVEMNTQNQLLSDSIRHMQVQMQENTLHMQQQMDNLVNLMMANQVQGEPKEVVAPTTGIDDVDSHLGQQQHGENNSTHGRVANTHGSGCSFAPPLHR